MNFSQQSLDFLFENRIKDSKPWFLEHRDIYERTVLEPMRELVETLTPAMLSIDSRLICEPKVGKSISRIYRDTRFSHDKSIFREKIWCLFIRDKKLYDGLPAYFLEVTPDGFSYGCGYYKASTASMDAFRELILNDDKSFISAKKAVEKSKVFSLDNDRYKRSKFPEQPEEKKEWLDLRSVCAIAYSADFDLLFSDRLAEKVSSDFKSISPFYDFLMKVENRKI